MIHRVSIRLAVPLLVALCAACAPRRVAEQPRSHGVTVLATWRGAPASEMLKSVAIPLERELRGIKGVRRVIVRCDADSCSLFLQHDASVNGGDIAYLAGAAIRRLRRELPRDARAVVRSYDVRRPPDIVIALVLDPDEPEAERRKAAQTFGRRVMRLPSAVHYEVVGSPEKRIEVVVDPERAALHGITAEEVERIIRERIVAVDEYTTVIIRSAKRKPGAAVGDILLRTVGNAIIRVRDIATIEVTLTPGALHRVDGEPAAIVNVYLRSEASPAEVTACLDRVFRTTRPRSVRRIIALSMRTD